MAKKQTDSGEGAAESISTKLVEVVPILLWRPQHLVTRSPRYGEPFEGPLNKVGDTYPGLPVKVTKGYAEELVEHKLAVYPDDFYLDLLPGKYRNEFDNPKRWAGRHKNPNAPATSDKPWEVNNV